MDSDFQIVKRTADESGKYAWLSFNQPNVDMQNALVVSHADMQFKFSPAIYKRFLQKIGDQPHFGYTHPKNSFWKALSNWVTSRYYQNAQVNQNTTVLWNNTINSVAGCVECLTLPGDQVLIICPIYYFFFEILRQKNRKIVQFLLDTKDNRFYIDFQKLEQLLKSKNIKLLIFCNPWNPCGRIWSKQELKKLSELILRYKFFIISDEIYSDSIQPSKQQTQEGLGMYDVFTSMLIYQQIHKYLVYVSSYTKAFNSSGMPLSYSICFSEQLHKKMKDFCIHEGDWPNFMCHDLLEIIYTVPEAQEWRKKSIDYIMNNFKIFKQQCQQKLPKLIIYDLQCSYLCLVDFSAYNIAGNTLKQKFTAVSVCPTFMEKSFDFQQDRSLIRLNLAMNEKLIVQLVDRMKKMIQLIE